MRRLHSISVSSSVGVISESLRFYEIPKDDMVSVSKLARHGRVTVYQDDAGKLFSSSVRFSGHFTFGRGQMDDYLHCAATLGVITKSELRKHLRDAAEFDKKRRTRDMARDFTKQAERIGIQLTAKQKRQIEKLD